MVHQHGCRTHMKSLKKVGKVNKCKIENSRRGRLNGNVYIISLYPMVKALNLILEKEYFKKLK